MSGTSGIPYKNSRNRSGNIALLTLDVVARVRQSAIVVLLLAQNCCRTCGQRRLEETVI